VAKTRDKLIPYFDLFDRLDDSEISRIAQVDKQVVSEVRTVVESIYDPLRKYENLLETLDDAQLCKLFGFPKSAAAIWRHCRAPGTLAPDQRQASGLLDEMMGEDDDDLLIVVDEDDPAEQATGPDPIDDGWGDL
jgi:hypothetical protein